MSTQTPPTLYRRDRRKPHLDNAGHSEWYGNRKHGTVSENVVRASFDGIDLMNGSSASVTANTIINTQRGITIANTGTVEQNTIWNSSIAGIELFGNGATV